ncbi:MAG: ABC transporter ATP-binding protein [Candidatus Caldatribacterium sp.]|nr:ABC transporter ATP-binding protein [Candidatus Caldatribacterium sp.]
MGTPIVAFEEVVKLYPGGVQALKGVSFSVNEGDFLCLIGPSGCGKTTLLKLVNRLLEPTSGRIWVYGRDARDWDPVVLRRRIGYVIQQIGLFPHLTVEENITYVLSIMGVPKGVRRKRAEELLHIVNLDPSYLFRFPRELSGGERQRVGVARALAADPELILMDEPFGALDQITREQLQNEFLELHGKLKKTVIFVTHDLQEAMRLATTIGVMREGKMVQIGAPYELLFSPQDPFVEDFLGRGGLFQILRMVKIQDVPLLGLHEKENQGVPQITVSLSTSLGDALRKMLLGGERFVAVTEDGTDRLVGVLSFEDLCRLLHRYCTTYA